MKEKITQLVSKGERNLNAARRDFENRDYDLAASRAYYAMFHLTEALLSTKGIATSKHSSLISLFYEHFVKIGLIEKSFHQALRHAFDLRQEGDYWSEGNLDRNTVSEAIKNAERYIVVLKKLLPK